MGKDDVAAALREMADLLEISGANAFEFAAYRRAAQGLEDWSGDLDQAVSDEALTDIPSVGKRIARIVADLVQTAKSTELQRVRARVPKELPALLKFRGLGPKRVRALWQELGIESPADLRQAANDGRVQTLKGFGAKTVEKMIASLDYFGSAAPAVERHLSSADIPKAPAASGRIWAGTSGYSYPAWKGKFYPKDARTDDLLEHYAHKLGSVEINNTFYRFPSEDVVSRWRSQTPDDFLFSFKAHRRVTHQLRLGPKIPEEVVGFVERCAQVGSRLGCILFQLPPNFRRDDTRLVTLLACLPAGPRYAIEFRHASWFDDDVLARLAEHNIACVAGDADNQEPRYLVTADFIYARLRRPRYTKKQMDDWGQWIEEQSKNKRDVLVYLKHDDTGAAPKSVVKRWPG